MPEDKQPNVGDYKINTTPNEPTYAEVWNGKTWIRIEEFHIVALTPKTGTLLYHAWYAEQSRIRHLKEFWIGQAERDATNRELWRRKAIDAGVPEAQADTYIFSGPWDGEV